MQGWRECVVASPSFQILQRQPRRAFYYLFADGFPGGQSLGKRWLGMRAIDATTGAPCTFGQSFIRNLLLAVLGPIDWVVIFGESHQRLRDKAADTIVVDAD